jgi:hypothetical protein
MNGCNSYAFGTPVKSGATWTITLYNGNTSLAILLVNMYARWTGTARLTEITLNGNTIFSSASGYVSGQMITFSNSPQIKKNSSGTLVFTFTSSDFLLSEAKIYLSNLCYVVYVAP